MLFITDKKAQAVGRLAVSEYEALVAAFAQAGAMPGERERGTAVVRKYQQQRRWFGCDCLGAGEGTPILVPVAEAHIRRDPTHPDHADGCPFELDAHDRLLRARALREQEPAHGFKLARVIVQPGAASDPKGAHAPDDAAQRDDAGRVAGRGPSKAYYRNRLSQALFKLLSDARVHQVGAGPRGLDAQRQALRQAAQGISLGGDLRLSEVLETDPAAMGELVRRIAARRTWPKGRRPHGVSTFVAESIEGDTLVAVGGERIAVRGAISVFGPGRGARRRGPFIVAVLVASPDGQQPLAPLEAYAHPCWSPTDLLPLDSSHERRCLDILVRFQDWMATQGCQVALTKPLHDRSGYYLGQEAGDAVVKPDFEGTIHAAGGGFLRSFAVEVMGYDRPEYRAAKVRVKAAITGKRVFYLEHLAHDPAGMEEHDRAFRSSLAQLGERAVSKARDMPARLTPPILPTLSPAAARAIPNHPDQLLAVPRAFTQATGSPASGSRLAPTPVQPGPAQTADAQPPIRLVPPAAAVVLDPGQVAGPPSRRSWLGQRLLHRLRLRR